MRKTIVVHPAARGATESEKFDFDEAIGLAEALEGWHVVERLSGIWHLREVNSATYLGKGKVAALKESIRELVEATAERLAREGERRGANPTEEPLHVLLFLDATLTASQQRNLEQALAYDGRLPPGLSRVRVQVWDRFAVILEIFSERARTKEARLQVELARIAYMRSRLRTGGSGRFGMAEEGAGLLEIVSGKGQGGAGKLGGSGEQQLEIEKRLLKEREAQLREELEKVRRTRAVQRKGRGLPSIALVGYTNAGKSSLLRALSRAGEDEVLVKDQLFSTLDPTIRAVYLPASQRRAAISDTVGFISHLPTTLVESFKATLEEVVHADLILLVRDVSSPLFARHAADVAHVLQELGIDPAKQPSRILEIWNKVDKISPEALATRLRDCSPPSGHFVLVSATEGRGLDRLLAMIDEHLQRLRPSVPIAGHHARVGH
eukprot:tig00020703_g13107.t1